MKYLLQLKKIIACLFIKVIFIKTLIIKLFGVKYSIVHFYNRLEYRTCMLIVSFRAFVFSHSEITPFCRNMNPIILQIVS